MLPKIIHQTWKTRDLPAAARRIVRSWREHHPDWEYRLWTDDDNRELIARSYPELLPTYDGYRYGVQRADIARVAILHRFGGVYADLDVECLASVDGLFAADRLNLLVEPEAHESLYGIGSVVSNAIMAAPAGDPVLREILDGMRAAARTVADPIDILGTTGPLFLTRLVARRGEEGIQRIPSRAFFPVPAKSPLLDDVLERRPGFERHLEGWTKEGARGVHYWVNSWSRDMRGSRNGHTEGEIDGFVFHPGMDCHGFDIGFRDRNIRALAEECRARPEAVAFNTDGYLKFYLPRRRLWQRMRWADSSHGLYVKRSYGWLAWLRSFVRVKLLAREHAKS